MIFPRSFRVEHSGQLPSVNVPIQVFYKERQLATTEDDQWSPALWFTTLFDVDCYPLYKGQLNSANPGKGQLNSTRDNLIPCLHK